MSFNSNTFAYHNISNRFNVGINNISPKTFKKHIKFYETLKNVTLCFDDGYEDIFAIKDFINTSQIKPVIFPVTNFISKYNDWDVNFFINRKKHLNIEQLRILYSKGWVIGSHGHTHISYKILNNREIYFDMKESKRILEDIIGKNINSFTPPFGYFKPDFIKIAKDVGYTKVYINNCYITEFNLKDSIIINRYNVYKHDTIRSIIRKINNNKLKKIIDDSIHKCSNATVFVKKLS